MIHPVLQKGSKSGKINQKQLAKMLIGIRSKSRMQRNDGFIESTNAPIRDRQLVYYTTGPGVETGFRHGGCDVEQTREDAQ